jgi:dTDP-4-dehydrorhamnose 3,5-epimerase
VERVPVATVRIAGVKLIDLEPNPDARGALTEVCRHTWLAGREVPVQWDAVRSEAGVLRGLHWHNRRYDYLVPVLGRIVVGLVDLRAGSPTESSAEVVEVMAERGAVVIPTGVGHGFWSPEPTIAMYAITEYWDPDDELGVRWDDPALGIPWPEEIVDPLLSERDAALPPLADAPSRPVWDSAGG